MKIHRKSNFDFCSNAYQDGQNKSIKFLVDNRPSSIAQRKLQQDIVSRISKPLSGYFPIQRAVGFEFEIETPLYTRKDQQETATNYEKNFIIHQGEGFHIVQDHAAKSYQTPNNISVLTIPEVVIEHTDDEVKFLANLANAQNYITSNIVGNTKLIVEGEKIGEGVFIGSPYSLLGSTSVGSGQATFGILPEGVEDIFKYKLDKLLCAQEGGNKITDLKKSIQNLLKRKTLLGSKEGNIFVDAIKIKQESLESTILEGEFEKGTLGEIEILRSAISSTSDLMKLNIFSGVDESEKKRIKGYLMLICQYCASNSIFSSQEESKANVIDKNKVPFLVRSTFGDIAIATLTPDSLSLLKANVDTIYATIIASTKANELTPIISHTAGEKEILLNANVSVWLKNAIKAEDEGINWGSQLPGEDSKVILPYVIINGQKGAVVEERNLKNGPVSIQNWTEVAKEVYTAVNKANNNR